ncbi:MAG: putative ATP-dependent RNA helicase ddx56 [Phylliscum demangeonii]|nr:MAG: putative ATP-dependent RNA helicase ddx56 [Phylliscum demangeonii]
MKRKFDDRETATETSKSATEGTEDSFAAYGLDPRILQSLVKEKYLQPTPVQARAIPLALEGKDVLARAKTGSGKTAAYIIPIIQAILKRKAGSDSKTDPSALILVPTRELASQVLQAVVALTAYCPKEVQALNLGLKVSDAAQRALLADSPDIVVATPARALLQINNGALVLHRLSHLVIDEADLLLSYGYEVDLQNVARSIPKGTQTILMSATLTTEVDTLKGLFCRDPVVLDLKEKDDAGAGVSQYVIRCGEADKFLLLCVIFKLKLIKGKCIIFVGDIDRCYRVKLYLEQFGIKGCVLNSELPVNSRIHVVDEFNKNIYDHIIATDENEVVDVRRRKRPADVATETDGADDDGEGGMGNGAGPEADPERKKAKRTKGNRKEYGISRGIDFKNVACVLNFDLPTSASSYTHRIGRTARAGNSGMALSFVVPHALYGKHKPTSFRTAADDDAVFHAIEQQQQQATGKTITPHLFDMKQVEGFRYRADDALRAVTRIAIRSARSREIRHELVTSEKLRRHFEENPADLRHLRHDGDALRGVRAQPHLKHVPDYLLSKDRQRGLAAVAGPVTFGGEKGERKKKGGRGGGGGGGGKGRPRGTMKTASNSRRKIDPLKSFRTGRKH